MNKFNFFKTTMPKPRIADYFLGCLDSSVFIDLNLNNNGQIYLKRISFDRYGCCKIENSITLNRQDSITFVDEMNKELIILISVE